MPAILQPARQSPVGKMHGTGQRQRLADKIVNDLSGALGRMGRGCYDLAGEE